MPRFSVIAIRISLIFLLLGFALGAVLLVNEVLPFTSTIWSLTRAHIEMLLIGFMAQLAIGVAFWILPRFMEGPPRGNETIAWVSLVFLNLGIVCTILSFFLDTTWLGSCGRILEALGGGLFLAHAWPRVHTLNLCKDSK